MPNQAHILANKLHANVNQNAPIWIGTVGAVTAGLGAWNLCQQTINDKQYTETPAAKGVAIASCILGGAALGSSTVGHKRVAEGWILSRALLVVLVTLVVTLCALNINNVSKEKQKSSTEKVEMGLSVAAIVVVVLLLIGFFAGSRQTSREN